MCSSDLVSSRVESFLTDNHGRGNIATGELALDKIDGVVCKVKLSGPAAAVMTVRVAVTQKLREKIPSIAAVQLV